MIGGMPPIAPLSSELRHCTAYLENTRSHLGSTLGSGKSCPDPGRLSTFGVSGLYPCRRLTYRGACVTHPGTGSLAGQTFTRKSFTSALAAGQIRGRDQDLVVEGGPRNCARTA